MALADEPLALASGGLRPGAVRGVNGFFRTAQDEAGRWWLLAPDGARFFGKCVHGVRAAGGVADGALPIDAAARLRRWGFNAVGVSEGAVGRDDGLPFMASVEFCNAGPTLVAPGLRLPDVFDPEWPRRAQEHAAAVCGASTGCRELIGWVTDNRIGWAPSALVRATHSTSSGQASAGQAHSTNSGQVWRPSLLQLCLSLEPGFAAYHAAWEFVLALHGGRLEAVARAWATALPNKEVVRELTRTEEGLGTRGYLRDEARWTRETARRYFTVAAAAVRAADPNHLVLGCRFGGVVGAQVLAECAYPAIDVAMPDWRELPAAHPAPATLSTSSGQAGSGRAGEAVASNPVIAGDVGWEAPDFSKLPTAARVMRLTSVEWMLRRGRTALERMARHPAVVGYAWSQWQDEPGEQPPFARGLVHVNGAEAREHTELLAQFNGRAESFRRAAALSS